MIIIVDISRHMMYNNCKNSTTLRGVITFNLRRDKKPNGRIYLSIGQGYRDVNGKSKSTTIQSLGYVDELMSQFSDPIAHFEGVVSKMNKEAKEVNASEIMYFDKSIT